MPKLNPTRPKSLRLSMHTINQLVRLSELLEMTQPAIVTLAIDRMYRQETERDTPAMPEDLAPMLVPHTTIAQKS